MSKNGSRKRNHSQQFKIQIVERNLRDGISVKVLALEYQLEPRLIREWRTRYLEKGEDGLKPKAKGRPKGSIGAGRHRKHFSSELERLKYENTMLKLENMRLKKLHELLRRDAKYQ